jgi:hypothetical protein
MGYIYSVACPHCRAPYTGDPVGLITTALALLGGPFFLPIGIVWQSLKKNQHR